MAPYMVVWWSVGRLKSLSETEIQEIQPLSSILQTAPKANHSNPKRYLSLTKCAVFEKPTCI